LHLVERLSALLAEDAMRAADIVPDLAAPAYEQALDYAANDLAMPRVLDVLWRLVKEGEDAAGEIVAAVAAIDGILGLELLAAAGRYQPATADESELDEEVKQMVERREEARRGGDYASADRIRALLEERGVELRDTADGVRWRLTRPSAGGSAPERV
jgi:cysteinyl-tRNA synthetase